MMEYCKWNNGFWDNAILGYGTATNGIDDEINPPAADHYSIFGANSEAPENLYILSRL